MPTASASHYPACGGLRPALLQAALSRTGQQGFQGLGEGHDRQLAEGARKSLFFRILKSSVRTLDCRL